MDLGECPKVHDLALRADFENASKKKDYYYDVDAMEHLQAFIADCDRRTEAAKKRLAETQEELTAEVGAKANAVHELAEEIGKKLAKAEALGEAGQVEESMKLMSEIDELRAKKTKAEQEYRSAIPASSYQQQKLRVCEVCSAYLGIHDNDVRLADHFGGKLHLGFLAIREKLIELEKTAAPRQKELRKSGRRDADFEEGRGRSRFVGGRELDRRSRALVRSKDRERRDDRTERKRSSERSDRRRSKSRDRRSRSRDRQSDNNKDRDRERHERNRDRGDRDRDRDRDRDHRDRRRRSHSRERSRR
ncbi:putative RNA-binding protein Luc7-like 2 isoform X2 [Toxorhynchites rutilus septentrionalis]|nr:putative RNA-binding protein Luc7-like 2 isoform X2 [Toxorhynchites rutilus septentrionalis]XP_055637761.1 putative RNA-binding protein Luc7-like 2 isoform X2 [Toxorhynchites rutilus septentrionalis]XP_055637763.1 putative RNA-binding protein Luc7-like 2 isoform X2 [Toxorhynchites rutilus septentrionalis]